MDLVFTPSQIEIWPLDRRNLCARNARFNGTDQVAAVPGSIMRNRVKDHFDAMVKADELFEGISPRAKGGGAAADRCGQAADRNLQGFRAQRLCCEGMSAVQGRDDFLAPQFHQLKQGRAASHPDQKAASPPVRIQGQVAFDQTGRQIVQAPRQVSAGFMAPLGPGMGIGHGITRF